MKQTVQLENLSCQNCVKHVTPAFPIYGGDVDVVVDLEKQTAQVATDKLYGVSDYMKQLARTIYRYYQLINA